MVDENSADFRKAEQDAYKLIMRDKERLLSFDEPRCFVFAHSALHEGWDNPDWGIARIDEAGKPVIYKIRETKGSADIGRLRFDHEKRKVRCAQKYFAALGIDYRPITGDTKEWWTAELE